MAFIIAVCIFIISLGITLYPIISTVYNDHHQSEIHTQHQQIIEDTDKTELCKIKESAMTYNRSIQPGSQVVESFSIDAINSAAIDYGQQLNLNGDSIMGYINIPKINVNLPIYHGTDDATLELGIGHLLGSSLPVGGPNTHAILTAHSGMASQKMFSDLPQLAIGDIFYLDILDERLAYMVDQIKTVLPHDTSFLGIEYEQDLCTLVTCTPFGVNTHRLLVRGHRIPSEEAEVIVQENTPEVSPPSTWEQEYFKGVLIGLAMVGAAGIIIIIFHFHRRGRYESR